MIRLTIALALAPAFLLLWLFKKWDEKRPEPPGAVRNMVFWGVATCLPAAGVEMVLMEVLGKSLVNEQGGFLNAFLVAATTEESFKLLVVLLFLWRKPYFDEVMDGILYTAAASLGFAMLENVLYSAGNLGVGLLRAFTAVPLHAVCSGIMGYFVGRGKMSKGSAFGWVALGLFFAVLIHGTYDWAVFSGGFFGFAPPEPAVGLLEVIVIVVVCMGILYGLVRHALRLDDAIHGPEPRPLATANAAPPFAPYGAQQPYAQQPPAAAIRAARVRAAALRTATVSAAAVSAAALPAAAVPAAAVPAGAADPAVRPAGAADPAVRPAGTLRTAAAVRTAATLRTAAAATPAAAALRATSRHAGWTSVGPGAILRCHE